MKMETTEVNKATEAPEIKSKTGNVTVLESTN